MRIKQDLCIALVLAVIGSGLSRQEVTRTDAEDGLGFMEGAVARNGLSDAEAAAVLSLIQEAQERNRAGDEDGAAAVMAEASALLRIA